MNKFKKSFEGISKWLPLYLFAFLFLFTSCKETEEDEEFANWQEQNDNYFQQIYANAMSRIAAGDNSWKIIRNWSLGSDNEDFHADVTDNIVVHVITESASTSPSPLYTDSVRIHYRGKLIPSPSYPSGYVFDKSYDGELNPETAVPAMMGVSGSVDGFCTALQNMKVGNRWEVYVPYHLGYDDDTQTDIPAYSTLIFDIQLLSYYHPGQEVPDFKGKEGILWIEE